MWSFMSKVMGTGAEKAHDSTPDNIKQGLLKKYGFGKNANTYRKSGIRAELNRVNRLYRIHKSRIPMQNQTRHREINNAYDYAHRRAMAEKDARAWSININRPKARTPATLVRSNSARDFYNPINPATHKSIRTPPVKTNMRPKQSWRQKQEEAEQRREETQKAKGASGRAWNARMYKKRTEESNRSMAAKVAMAKKAAREQNKAELAWSINIKKTKTNRHQKQVNSILARNAARKHLPSILKNMKAFDHTEKKPWKALEGLPVKNMVAASLKYKDMLKRINNTAAKAKQKQNKLQKRNAIHARISKDTKNAHVRRMTNWWAKREHAPEFTGRRQLHTIHALESAQQNNRVAAALREGEAALRK
jgi:hypothetical protein